MIFSKLKIISNKYFLLRKYIKNTFWVVGSNFFGLGLTFISTAFVARYLGPENFGSLTYAISLVGLFSAAGHLGLQGLVVREIVKNESDCGEILGTALILKFIGMAAGYGLALLFSAFNSGVGDINFFLIAIVGLALIFKPIDVIDFWFQAHVQAKYTALSLMLSHLAASIFKMALVILGSGLLLFAAAQVLQAVVAVVFFLIFYYFKSKDGIFNWSFNWGRAKDFLKQGWLIYLGSFFAVVNLKIDQVMLEWLSNTREVGLYAVAAQLSEAWYFVPAAIVASFFPKLIALRKENKEVFKYRLQQLFDGMFMLGLLVALAMTIAAPWLINLFFGKEYLGSVQILITHTWAAIFIFMRSVFSRWILIEGYLVLSLATQGIGALINVFLNFILIPEYGGIGSAYATLISYATSSFFALLFFRKSRPIFWQMVFAFFAPFRYIVRFVRIT